jgi:hypothetical protein
MRCECDKEGILRTGMGWKYDEKTERPFVNHKPGECKCVNDLKKYMRKGKVIWLCSCCTLGNEEVIE